MRSATMVAPQVFWWIRSVVSCRPRRREIWSNERRSTKCCVAALAERIRPSRNRIPGADPLAVKQATWRSCSGRYVTLRVRAISLITAL